MGFTLTYDEENRLASAALVSGGMQYYGYAPDNKRIYEARTGTWGPVESWALYGAHGEKLGDYWWFDTSGTGDCYHCGMQTSAWKVWFGGKLIYESPWTGTSANGAVMQDQVGTNRANGARFLPYGEELTSTANEHVKFGTYTRDSFTGLDYADQRYYSSYYGRFVTVDPMGGSANPRKPGSWNRYVYAGDDPVNRGDPSGKMDCWTYYLLLTIEFGDSDPNSSDMGNCAGLQDAMWANLDPCSVYSELRESVGLTCDATPPCYQAQNSGACAGPGGGGTDPVQTDQSNGGGPGLPVLVFADALPKALKLLANFSPSPNSLCEAELGLLGLGSKNVQDLANGGATFVDALTKPELLAVMIDKKADFAVPKPGDTQIYFYQGMAWETSMAQLEGAILHEFLHVGNRTDLDILGTLFGPGTYATKEISERLTKDCFGD